MSDVKISDYVAEFLAQQGVRHAFVVSGGASLHLIHSVADQPGIDYVCPQHEQAGAMAADAYARVTGNLGCAMATSGPGATNLITGIACAYFDSVPTIFVTGNVSTFRMRGESGVRQLGFQETDIVSMVESVTKYAVLIEDPLRIRHELEKACHIARSGRPGPVLVDIPDNVQRMVVRRDQLEGYTPPPPQSVGSEQLFARALELIATTKRPVLVLGWGVRLAGAVAEALSLADQLGFPILPTWGAKDMLPAEHPLLAGTFGTHGTRHANYAIQNADLILSIGSSLDTHATGTPAEFGRCARKIVVDIDGAELQKFAPGGLNVDLAVEMDAGEFIAGLSKRLGSGGGDYSAWFSRISAWQERYPHGGGRANSKPSTLVDPYELVKALGVAFSSEEVIFMDTGCGVAWMGQAFPVRAGQRLFSAFNNTPMGYALPAAIGASFALDRGRVICISGDGGLQLNLQELVTAVHYELPIKIVLLNNRGHAMIRQTQDQWLGSRYLASCPEGGVGQPDFVAVAQAYGLTATSVASAAELPAALLEALVAPGPVLLNVEISPAERVIPQVRYGRPLEDPEPLLPRKEFLADMLIEPLEVSQRELSAEELGVQEPR